MKRSVIRILCAAVCTAFLVQLSPSPAYANSAQQSWAGVTSSGVILSDETSPIEVEKEILTFDLPDSPSLYYNNTEEYLAYANTVSAEYTFCNPSDMEITARLFFPFGPEPTYARGSNADKDKFEVLVNGTPVEKHFRASFMSSAYFSLETDLSKLQDEYAEHEFYYPGLPVIKYVYQFSGIDYSPEDGNAAALSLPQNNTSFRIYTPNDYGSSPEENKLMLYFWPDEEDYSAELYVFGENTKPPEWQFFKTSMPEDGTVKNGKAVLTESKSMTFEEFVFAEFTDYTPESGVSRTDWYNACIANLDGFEDMLSYGLVNPWNYDRNLFENLMRWYEYEITLKPGEQIVNTVTAPIYPGIDHYQYPEINKYTYLLSPARTWKNFGALEIFINTPYPMVETKEGISASLPFEKTENGYSCSQEGLPDTELTFELYNMISDEPIVPSPSGSSSKLEPDPEPYPESNNGPDFTDWILTGILIISGAVILFISFRLIGLVTLLITVIIKKIRRRKP